MEGLLSGVDESAPWWRPWRDLGGPALAAVRQGMPVHRALDDRARLLPGMPVRFVEDSALPAGEAYERHIFSTRRCPTRENLHDLCNGVVWLGMPASKSVLNALQAQEIQARGIGGVRGPVRDAITVFDENGALLDAPAALWEALLARQWHRLFVDLRPLWREARLLVFGHALLEKLRTPRKDMTAHVWRAQAPLQSLPSADAWLACQLDATSLAAKPFTPLPVLGIPGWSQENENFSFYDDSLVFRPPRQAKGGDPGQTPGPVGQ